MLYFQNPEKSIDEICEALDNLTIENLELIEKKVTKTVELENLLRKGHIELAKARYIQGKENVGILQIPNEEFQMKSLFNLQSFPENEKLIENIDEETSATHFYISLRKLDKDDKTEPQDPIKWFGVLVPQSLKTAQKHFQQAVYVAVELANIQAQLLHISKKLVTLKPSKEIKL